MKKVLDDIKSARWAIILIIAYFAFLKNYLYTICPVVLLSGYPCPGCGMTRAMFKVLRLDFAGAWEMHPFIYPIGILFLSFCISRYFLNGKYMKYVKVFMIIIAVGMIVFYIYRMITLFPDVTPMTYYYGNYFNRLMNLIQKL